MKTLLKIGAWICAALFLILAGAEGAWEFFGALFAVLLVVYGLRQDF